MKQVNINISKARVMDEVAKSTAYQGAKAVNAEDIAAYDRIAVTDADRELLDRYWMEACHETTTAMQDWLQFGITPRAPLGHHMDLGNDYKVSLCMTDNWPGALKDSVETHLTGYIINTMIAKWCMMTAKGDVEAYAALGATALEQARKALLTRQRPAKRGQGKFEPRDDDNDKTKQDDTRENKRDSVVL